MITPSSGYGGAPLAMRIELTVRVVALVCLGELESDGVVHDRNGAVLLAVQHASFAAIPAAADCCLSLALQLTQPCPPVRMPSRSTTAARTLTWTW